MKKLIKYSLALFILSIGYSQEIKVNDKQRLETSFEPFINGSINGKVELKNILRPDETFSALIPFGKPINIDENHTGAGDEFTFKYKGFSLSYNNTNEKQEMRLVYLELFGSQSYLGLVDNSKLKVGSETLENKKFSVIGDEQYKNRRKNSTMLRFHDYESSKIVFDFKDKEIEKIRIWF